MAVKKVTPASVNILNPLTAAEKEVQPMFEALIKREGGVMVQWVKGRIYILWKHYRYLDPGREASKVYLYPSKEIPLALKNCNPLYIPYEEETKTRTEVHNIRQCKRKKTNRGIHP